mgnify:CR=1 FL=1|jgi:magnesium chelatase family protein
MSLAVVFTRACVGIHAPLVTVEVHLTPGLPGFSIVGLAETAVKESRDRIRSALISNRFTFPARKIIVNLAPADLPKEGGCFDLPIAIGILLASKQIHAQNIAQYELSGELGLTGEIRSIKGALPFAIQSKSAGRLCVLPQKNAYEASLAEHDIYLANHISQVSNFFLGKCSLDKAKYQAPKFKPALKTLHDIKGQVHAKKALVVAAAGGHHVLLSGPPGTGKTMLAERLNSLLPPPSQQELLQIASLKSVYSKRFSSQWQERPFRRPHHSASSPALVGGGNPPKPGEISLAHCGVLFLDELPEFQRGVLEALREPLEFGEVTISRAKQQLTFPARFQLIAAMNPCPCGYLGDSEIACRCTPNQISNYQRKISGPLLDRIDLHVGVLRLPFDTMLKEEKQSSLENLYVSIDQARERQMKRQKQLNAHVSQKALMNHCQLSRDLATFYFESCEKLKLSMRVTVKLLKVARTIADLQDVDVVKQAHLEQALSYRYQEITF